MPSIRRRALKSSSAFGGHFSTAKTLGPNPGALTGSVYVPGGLQRDAPLIVVLHGCTQMAEDYAGAAGWLELADRHGFAVLLPQQARANNANLCFNWFQRGDIQRDKGEPASIKSMMDDAIGRYDLDKGQVFVTGLSAGAAMAATMLACYPEAFAGGGLIAGLPHGAATSLMTALQQMRGGPSATGVQLAVNVTAASGHQGPWPRVSIWHGGADLTVNDANGDASVNQWLAVHGLENTKPKHTQTADFSHRTWSNARGEVQIEYITISSMGHGTPIDLRKADSVGSAAPFVLDAGIASTDRLLEFWGINHGTEISDIEQTKNVQTGIIARRIVSKYPSDNGVKTYAKQDTGVTKIINDALRAAGLMR